MANFDTITENTTHNSFTDTAPTDPNLHKDMTSEKASGQTQSWTQFGNATNVAAPGVLNIVGQILGSLVQGKPNLTAQEIDSFVELAFTLANKIILKYRTYATGVSGVSGV